MTLGETKSLATHADVIAPDGSEVRLLAKISNGTMAEFRLQPNQTTKAVAHHTVEELWFVVEGQGQIWRRSADSESIETLEANVSISIPTGVSFQFRNTGETPLRIIGTTMPPWPGADEAYDVKSKW